MLNINLLKVLLLLNLILLLGTIGKSQDTTKCYTRVELQKIAIKVIRANECDTLLINTEKQNQSLLVKLDNKDKEIINVNKENNLRNSIIVGKIKDLEVVQTENQILTDKIKWIKFGSAIVGVLILAEHILIALILGN